MYYDLEPENKGVVDAALDFPRLKLEKKGEKARIALFSLTEKDGKIGLAPPKIAGGYFFDLQNPLSDQPYQGSYECLAPEDVKIAGEYAPDECPHCEFVSEGIGVGGKVPIIRKRKRRMVVPVVKYRTNLQGQIMEPYSVDVVAWKFTDRYFNALVDEHKRWAETDGLLGHDLTLTCDVPKFHTYSISAEPNCAYRASKDRMRMTVQVYRSMMDLVPQGLLRICGASLDKHELRRRIQNVLDEVSGARDTVGGTGSAIASGGATLEEVFAATPTDNGAGERDTAHHVSEIDFEESFEDFVSTD